MPLLPPDPPGVVCTLQRREEGGMLLVGGLVRSDHDADGTYRLDIVKTGSAGSSTIRQSGRLALIPGQSVQAGRASLSIEPGAQYKVQLVVESGGREVTCQEEGGSK